MRASTLRGRRQMLLAAALLLAPSFASAQPAPVPGVQTVEFFSPAVNRTMKYNIVLPPDYESSNERYPVLYLLHGLTQDYVTWSRLGAPFYAREIGKLIVVMPDGGNSWYVNWAENGEGQKNDWEDHIVRDVVGHVDDNFRTLDRREGRAIAGLSMGGYGALTMGLRNSEMFISIGSTSGALEHARQITERLKAGVVGSRPERSTRVDPVIGIPGFSSQDERTPYGREFTTVEQAEAHDPFLLINTIPRHRMPHIYLDSGTEDELIQGARALAFILMQKNLPFDLMQMSGEHNGDYWRRSVGHLMNVQHEVMRRALGERPTR